MTPIVLVQRLIKGTALTALEHDTNITNLKTASDQLDAEKQPVDATLTALAAVTTVADRLIYATGADTFSTTTLSAAGRALIDDADVATMRTTLNISAVNTPSTAIGGIAATNVQAAIQELDSEKAPLASPILTGIPTSPTATVGTNTTQIATTAFVNAEIANDTFSKTELTMAIGNINSPLLDMPLKNSLVMKVGVGSATFTRASTATYDDRYGVLKIAAIDEPRFEKEGYLNEGASTNLILQSSDAATTWGSSGATVTVNTTETTAPDETTTSDILLETATTALHYNSQVYAGFTAGTTYTFSRFVKAKGRTKCAFSLQASSFGVTQSSSFDLTAKTATTTLGTATCKIEELVNGWFRCSITATATITASSQAQHFILDDTGASTYLGDITKGLYVFGGQLEALPFATSYIPTVASAVTRSADVLTVTGVNNIGSVADDHTIIVDFNVLGKHVVSPSVIQITGLTVAFSRVIQVWNSDGKVILDYYNAGSNSFALVDIPYTTQRVSSSYSNGSLFGYANGVLKKTTTGLVAPADSIPLNISIGSVSGGSAFLYGHISGIRIFDKLLTHQENALA